jgi:NAD(P)-dependent dehydrogenase (short-subunit alcohol dehydrogenase family)
MPVAIVTGAAQGIGRGIAIRLAQDGFDVTINDQVQQLDKLNSLAEEIREKNRRVAVVPANVSEEVEVETMVQKTVEELGGLDVVRAPCCRPANALTIQFRKMVSNAAVFVTKPLLESKPGFAITCIHLGLILLVS